MPPGITDTIGREIKIGDIIQYSTCSSSSISIHFGVVERFQSSRNLNDSNLKIRVARIEKAFWDTPNGKWRQNAAVAKGESRYVFNLSLLNSPHAIIIINDLNLPDNDKFNALHQKSKELQSGSAEN